MMLARKHAPATAWSDPQGLPASWYIALRSQDLGARPRPVQLFSRPLVAWRDSRGQPVLMPRHCPHMGASLALGKIVDDCIRCPFHHWRFDAAGTCVEIPGIERIPVIARQPVYPVVERYGFLWAWYGGEAPLFPLPAFPPLDEERDRYLAYRFADTTPATARQVLENAYDHQHFVTLHRVRAAQPMTLTLLSDQGAARDNGPPIAVEAWSGAVLECPELEPPAVLRALGMKAKKFRVLIDGWPAGQRFTFFVDDRVIAKELLGVTPVGPGQTVQQGWAMVKKTGAPWLDALFYLFYHVEHRAGTKQDLAIYRSATSEVPGVPVKYDRGVIEFRAYYQRWVERAERPDRPGGPDQP
jgi:phenylpropionate dioxygenase-like ring-hydroxylating dioxygenase large terminal subunit